MSKAHIALTVCFLGAAIFIGSLITPKEPVATVADNRQSPPIDATVAKPETVPKKSVDASVAAPKPVPQLKRFKGQLSANETMSTALSKRGLTPAQIDTIVDALKGIFDFRLARPGNSFEATLSADSTTLKYFKFEHGPVDIYEVKPQADGRLAGRKVEVKLETLTATLGVEIRGSLYASITDSGESPALVSSIVDVFAWDIDFYKDTKAGDRFKLIFEKKFKGDAFIGYGRILAAEYEGKTGKFHSFWYQHPKSKSGDYYLADGQSARKMFLATPLKFTRISSGFNPKRKHPILGYTKAHLAIDYAAPTGTPVWSMADGKVTYVGRLGAAGKVVRVKHSNQLTSSYAHLSRYARGIKRGMKIRQKQVIGYVGMTGRATGPHLHFTVRKKGKFVNPLKLKMTRQKGVAKRHRSHFKAVVAERRKQLDSVVISSKVKRTTP